MRCDRCGRHVRSSKSLEEMPNGDFVCTSCSIKEENAVRDAYRDAYIYSSEMRNDT